MIRSIDTEYKGYKFRSRLEARWAVFFDEIGVNWQYETEGFEDENGTRYMPDFKVERRSYGPTYVEIKPKTVSYEPFKRIYFAGRIQTDGTNPSTWRDELFERLAEKHQEFSYAGPDYLSHDTTAYDGVEQYIIERCFQEIQDSDIVYANIDTPDTVGTFIELGYARSLNKRILTYFSNKSISDTAWFAKATSWRYQIDGDPIDLFRDQLTPLTKEFTKARMMTKGKIPMEEILVMFRGDPMDNSVVTFPFGFEADWKDDHLHNVCDTFLDARNLANINSAAKKARSARFEFGEKG